MTRSKYHHWYCGEMQSLRFCVFFFFSSFCFCLCTFFFFAFCYFFSAHTRHILSQESFLVWERPSESPQKSPSRLSCKLQYTLWILYKKSCCFCIFGTWNETATLSRGDMRQPVRDRAASFFEIIEKGETLIFGSFHCLEPLSLSPEALLGGGCPLAPPLSALEPSICAKESKTRAKRSLSFSALLPTH